MLGSSSGELLFRLDGAEGVHDLERSGLDLGFAVGGLEGGCGSRVRMQGRGGRGDQWRGMTAAHEW